MKTLWLTTVLMLTIAACGSDKKKDSDGPDGGSGGAGNGGEGGAGGQDLQPPGTFTSLDDVEVGACGAVPRDSDFVSQFEVVECDELHYMEVAGRYELADAEYPGNAALILSSYEGCQPIFETYTGTPFWDSEYDIRTITPSPFTWSQGDRAVICLVSTVDGSVLSKSVAKP
jgi:hypothetical protein